MILYHGTRASLLPQILKEGLQPRSKTGSEGNYGKKHLKSRRDLVYLTTHYAGLYGLIATEQGVNEDVAIVKVDMAVDLMFPDEDFIRAALKMSAKGPTPNPRKFQHLAEICLKRMGTAAVSFVPPGRIVDSVVVPQEVPGWPFWLQHLGADAASVKIAVWLGVSMFDKFRDRTELLFKGGVEAVLESVREESYHQPSFMSKI